ncbi:hypothetical protein K2173_000972 [Erythroxylum novogranatense]|uniref:PTC1-like winged helix-turn-helix domain-containing protein n=1 Tax=Erythroxylum novogranatense TaxID=1862640 RepID=A0AAV8TQI4_9ROSI|nr:hypothetical protein K2173_000972 [Erythroxylum novogranatense]
MCLLMSSSSKGASELNGSFEGQENSSKKGICLLELRRTGMVHWSACSRGSIDQHEESNHQESCNIVKEECKDEEEAVAVESHGLPESRKRKRRNLNQVKETETAGCAKDNPNRTSAKNKRRSINQVKDTRAAGFTKESPNSVSSKLKQKKHENCKPVHKKKENFIDRWSIERYKLAEKRMLEVMKAEGAVLDNPISRPVLRMAARKHICDTGLLDHLLKHIDGKLAPGGLERFRRCYNTDGIMEYWLESADLVSIKREAGLPDPNYGPPSWLKPVGDNFRDSICAGELRLLKGELAKMKRDMEELVSKKQEEDQSSPIEEMHKELVKGKGKTDQQLMEISSSLSSMQDMYRELVIWKSKTEKQLKEITDSLSSLQTSKQCPGFSPASDRWEDWLESTNLDSIQGDDFASWFETTDLVNTRLNPLVQGSYSAPQPWLKPFDSLSQDVCTREQQLFKEEMTKMKRNMQELVTCAGEEAQVNVTTDSYATVNSKLDYGSSFLLFQEMFKDMVKWKAKVEQQMLQISNSVITLEATRKIW